MVITLSVVFHLLSEKYLLISAEGGSDNLPVHGVALLTNGDKPPNKPGLLYICANADPIIENQKGCAFIVCGKFENLSLSDGADAVFIEGIAPTELIGDVIEIFMVLQEWDLELKDAALERTNLQKIISVGNKLFTYSYAVFDRSYTVVGYTLSTDLRIFKGYEIDEYGRFKAPLAILNSLFENPEFADAVNHQDAFFYCTNDQGSSILCMNILSKGQYLGRIVSSCPGPETPGILYLFRHLCGYICEAFMNFTDDILARRQNDRIHRAIGSLVYERGELSIPEAEALFESRGWLAEHEYRVAVINLRGKHDFSAISLYLCGNLEQGIYDSCAVYGESEIVWVVNATLSGKSAGTDEIKQSIALVVRGLDNKSGISGSLCNVMNLSTLYDQAAYAMRNGPTRDPNHGAYAFSDFALYYMIDRLKPLSEQKKIIHSGLERLVGYDRAHGTELTPLLLNLIISNFSVTATSERTFIHRSTLNRHIRRIKAITGFDWDAQKDPDELLHILLSFKMLNI